MNKQHDRKLDPMPWKLRPVVLALACVLAVTGAITLLGGDEDGTPVLVSTGPIAEGAATNGVFKRTVAPQELVPADAIAPEDALPEVWSGPPIQKGTILTESLLAGSATSRGLASGRALVSIPIGEGQATPLADSDMVDVWAADPACMDAECAATLLSRGAIVVTAGTSDKAGLLDGGEEAESVALNVRAADIERILGYAGTGGITLVLSNPATGAQSQDTTQTLGQNQSEAW